MSRARTIISRYGWRTPIVVLAVALQRAQRLDMLAFRLWLRWVTYGRKGRRITFGSAIKIMPGSTVELGDDVTIGDRVHLEVLVNPRGTLRVGEGSWISHDCHVMSMASVDIGSHVLIGEFTSIRDSTHAYEDRKQRTRHQGDRIGTIRIEDDVWIGRGCLIQGKPEGIVIGHGAVIAANSVVKSSIPPFEVWGGVPARFIKTRGQEDEDGIK